MNATVPRKGRPRRRDGDRTTKRSQIAVSISDCGWRGRWCSRKHRLPQYLTGLIDEYLQEYRPILLRSRARIVCSLATLRKRCIVNKWRDAKNGPSRIRLVVRLSDVAFEGI